MASFDGQIFACRQEDRVLFRIVGQVTASSCPELRRYAENCFADGVRRVGIDLGKCTHFDSTFVGTLLFLKRRTAGGDRCGFALTATSPEAQQLLRRMTVSKFFPQVPDERSSVDPPWTPLKGDSNPQRMPEFKRNVVDAHQELAKLDGAVGKQFKEVAEACSRDLEKEQP